MFLYELLIENYTFDPDEEEKRDNAEIAARRQAQQQKQSRQYRGTLIKQYYGGWNGRPLPDDIKKLAAKHVKTATNGSLYINEYDAGWYPQTYKDPGASFETTVMKPLAPYFTVQRVKEIQRR